MTELTDYSGLFDPEFSHEKFTKETLIKLLKTYCEYMLRIDGLWYLTVMDKWGLDEAWDCDRNVWDKAQLAELQLMTRALNIHGDDIETVMKYGQCIPWKWLAEYKIDIKDRDHATVTFLTCPLLPALEKEGKGRERVLCQDFERRNFTIVAHYFNPNMSVTPIKVPPRTDYDDCCCQWEYKLER